MEKIRILALALSQGLVQRGVITGMSKEKTLDRRTTYEGFCLTFVSHAFIFSIIVDIALIIIRIIMRRAI